MTEKYNVTIERKLGDEFVVTDDPAAQHQVGGAMLARAEARMIAD